MIKAFIKDMVKYLPSQIVPGVVAFISIPIITRLFIPEDYGNYSLVMATVMVLTTLLGWLPTSIIRFYPSYERDRKLNVFYGNIIKLCAISIVVVAAVFWLILFSIRMYLSSGLYSLMSIGIGVFTVTAIFNVFQYFLRSKRAAGWYSGFAVYKSIGSFAIALLLIFFCNKGIESLLWGVILCIGIILPLLWRKAIGFISIIKTKINYSLAADMARYSFPLVVGNLAAWILRLSDRYVLAFLRGSWEVGIYSASYNISDRTIMLIGSLFMMATGPISMNIWEKEKKEKSKEFISKITRYYLMLCLPAVVGLSVLAKPLLSILVGQRYFDGYKVIPFVTLGTLFLGLQQSFMAAFLFYKRTGFVAVAIVISGLLNLCLNFIFIPKYGYMAAAATTLVSYATLLVLMVVSSRRIFVWRFPFKSLIKFIWASAIMGSGIYFISSRLSSLMPLNLVFSVCLGGLLYFLILLVLQEFQPKEKAAMKRVLSAPFRHNTKGQ